MGEVEDIGRQTRAATLEIRSRVASRSTANSAELHRTPPNSATGGVPSPSSRS